MEIYFLRHGETQWNAGRRLQGQTDIPLNELGRSLAVKTRKGLEEVEFDAAFASPLKRAYETAEIVLEGREIPIASNELIQEISFGIFEGLCCKGEGFNIPDPNFMKFFTEPGAYESPEGGESIEEFWERLKLFLDNILGDEDLQDKRILVASHGGAIRGMLSIIKGYGIEQFWEGGVQKNCAVSMVEYDGVEARIIEEGRVYYEDEIEDYYKF